MTGLYMPRECLFCTACSLPVHDTQGAEVDSEATDTASDASMDTVDSTRSDVRPPVDDSRRGHIPNVQEVDVKDEVLDEKMSDVLSESITDRRSGHRVSCSVCRRQFHPANLNRHMGTHFPDTLHTCIICHQKCSRRAHICSVGIAPVLSRRILQTCGVCGVRVSADLMERHMLAHGKRRGFICHVCNREFTKQCALNRHVQNHNRYNALLHVVFLLIVSH